jgi:hypothetical protein
MTLNKLASLIAKREGKKSQVHIGNIREILKIICTMEVENATTVGATSAESPMSALDAEINKRIEKKMRKKTIPNNAKGK